MDINEKIGIESTLNFLRELEPNFMLELSPQAIGSDSIDLVEDIKQIISPK